MIESIREVEFFETDDGTCEALDFILSQKDKVQEKIEYVFKLVEDLETIPVTFLKKLRDCIYEIRVKFENNIYRFLCFFYGGNLVVVTHGFQKKSQKTPPKEIKKAERIRREYIKRKE